MAPVIKYVLNNPVKVLLYTIGGVYVFRAVRWAAVSVGMICLAWYIDHSNSRNLERVKEFFLDWVYVSDSVNEATLEEIKFYGGRREYVRSLKFSRAVVKPQKPHIEETIAK